MTLCLLKGQINSSNKQEYSGVPAYFLAIHNVIKNHKHFLKQYIKSLHLSSPLLKIYDCTYSRQNDRKKPGPCGY